jgi:hypothetical protein
MCAHSVVVTTLFVERLQTSVVEDPCIDRLSSADRFDAVATLSLGVHDHVAHSERRSWPGIGCTFLGAVVLAWLLIRQSPFNLLMESFFAASTNKRKGPERCARLGK